MLIDHTHIQLIGESVWSKCVTRNVVRKQHINVSFVSLLTEMHKEEEKKTASQPKRKREMQKEKPPVKVDLLEAV